MNLLIFFALPLATILLAIVFQKILKNPILVAITFFAVYLIIAFGFFSDTLAEALIATIIYTIIAYITALIVRSICKIRRCLCNNQGENNNIENLDSDVLSLDCNCENNDENSINTNISTNNSTISTAYNNPYQYNVRRRMIRR